MYLTRSGYTAHGVGDTIECEHRCHEDDQCGGVNIFFSAKPNRFVCELMKLVPDAFNSSMASNSATLGFIKRIGMIFHPLVHIREMCI